MSKRSTKIKTKDTKAKDNAKEKTMNEQEAHDFLKETFKEYKEAGLRDSQAMLMACEDLQEQVGNKWLVKKLAKRVFVGSLAITGAVSVLSWIF